ncbi:Uncharacterised protein [Chlamydia abortus]|nr:Uncharacterised protein [Chlamydia abortus]
MKTDSYNKSTVWFLSTPIRIFARCAAADSIGGSFFCLIKVSKIGLVHDQRESRSHREERRLIYSKLNQYNSTFFFENVGEKEGIIEFTANNYINMYLSVAILYILRSLSAYSNGRASEVLSFFRSYERKILIVVRNFFLPSRVQQDRRLGLTNEDRKEDRL